MGNPERRTPDGGQGGIKDALVSPVTAFPPLGYNMRSLLILAAVISTTYGSTFQDAALLANGSDSLHHLFSMWDEDGNDAISTEELRNIRDNLNLQRHLTDENIENVLNQIDMNKDRHISYEDVEGILVVGLTAMFDQALGAVDRDKNRQISLDEAKEFINNLDKNGEGRLSFGELGNELDADLRAIIKTIDKNNDNQVSFDEVKDTVTDMVQRVIKAVDRDGDEKISLEEMKNLANPDTLPDTVMKTIDENGDGQFTYNEFEKLVTDTDLLSTVNSAIDRLDNALNNGARAMAEWKTYASIVGFGIVMSMYL